MAQVLEAVEEVHVAALDDAHPDAVRAYREQRMLTTSNKEAERTAGRRAFAEHIEPLLEARVVAKLRELKELVRAKMNAVAVDAIDIFSLDPDEELNGAALDFRDRLRTRATGAATA